MPEIGLKFSARIFIVDQLEHFLYISIIISAKNSYGYTYSVDTRQRKTRLGEDGRYAVCLKINS